MPGSSFTTMGPDAYCETCPDACYVDFNDDGIPDAEQNGTFPTNGTIGYNSTNSTPVPAPVVIADTNFENGTGDPLTSSASSPNVTAVIAQSNDSTPLMAQSGQSYLFLTFNSGSGLQQAQLLRRQSSDQPLVYNASQNFPTVAGDTYNVTAYAQQAQNGPNQPDCSISLCVYDSCSSPTPLLTGVWQQYYYLYLATYDDDSATATFSITCAGNAYVGLDNIAIVDIPPPDNSATASSTGDSGSGSSAPSGNSVSLTTLSGGSVITVTRTIVRTRTTSAIVSTAVYYTTTQVSYVVSTYESDNTYTTYQPTTLVSTAYATATSLQNITVSAIVTSTTTITQNQTFTQLSTAFVTATATSLQVQTTSIQPYTSYSDSVDALFNDSPDFAESAANYDHIDDFFYPSTAKYHRGRNDQFGPIHHDDICYYPIQHSGLDEYFHFHPARLVVYHGPNSSVDSDSDRDDNNIKFEYPTGKHNYHAQRPARKHCDNFELEHSASSNATSVYLLTYLITTTFFTTAPASTITLTSVSTSTQPPSTYTQYTTIVSTAPGTTSTYVSTYLTTQQASTVVSTSLVPTTIPASSFTQTLTLTATATATATLTDTQSQTTTQTATQTQTQISITTAYITITAPAAPASTDNYLYLVSRDATTGHIHPIHNHNSNVDRYNNCYDNTAQHCLRSYASTSNFHSVPSYSSACNKYTDTDCNHDCDKCSDADICHYRSSSSCKHFNNDIYASVYHHADDYDYRSRTSSKYCDNHIHVISSNTSARNIYSIHNYDGDIDRYYYGLRCYSSTSNLHGVSRYSSACDEHTDADSDRHANSNCHDNSTSQYGDFSATSCHHYPDASSPVSTGHEMLINSSRRTSTYTQPAQTITQTSTVTVTPSSITSLTSATAPAAQLATAGSRTTTASSTTAAPTVALASPTAIFNSSQSHDDDLAWRVMPFAINLCGYNFTNVTVSVNGVLGFGITNSWTPSSLPQYSALSPSGYALMPFWADLYIYQGTAQGIYYEVDGSSPSRVLTFEYYASYYQQSNNYYHFQVLFYENNTGSFTFKYLNITDSGANAVVGYQCQPKSKYKQYSSKQAIITNGLRVDYTYSNDTFTSSQVVVASRAAVFSPVIDFMSRIADKVSDTWRSATGWLRGHPTSTTADEVYLPKSTATFAENLGDAMDRRWVGGYGRHANLSTLV
ncbi:hypothetical protein KCU98_g1234, partial [Aureobasidium melanogenum]